MTNEPRLARSRETVLTLAVAAAMPAIWIAAMPHAAWAAHPKTIGSANIVTPSNADAAHPFAAPVKADFINYKAAAVEAPEVIANPASDISYLPNVVNSEDGEANNLAAYMAQAIAARAYFYYTQPQNAISSPPPSGSPAALSSQGYIINSQLNQVYAQVGGAATATANGANALEELAVQLTDGIVLTYNASNTVTSNDTLVDGFFVAGAVPTTSNTPFGNATGNSDPTGTQPDVTYNRGLTGNNVQGTQLGFIGNPANRGAMSQNGINFLSTHADPSTGKTFNYADSLRYFYGADIHMTVVSPNSAADRIQHAIPVETFGSDNGYFGHGVVSPGNVGVSSTVITHSTDSHDLSKTYLGSQVLQINASAAFTYENLAGLGPNSVQKSDGTSSAAALALVGMPAGNLNMPAIGTISYWAKVLSGAAATTSIVLNNDETGATQTSVAMPLSADGQWHQFTFSLSSASDFVNPNIVSGFDAYFSVHSIKFTGTGAATFSLSDLSFNEIGAVVGATQWARTGGGAWLDAASWTGDIPNASGAVASFLGNITAPSTVTGSASITVGAIAFNNLNSYTIQDASGLIIQMPQASDAGTVSATSGSHLITAGVTLANPLNLNIGTNSGVTLSGGLTNLSSKTIQKLGAGSATISGTQSHGANTSLVVAGGTLNLNSDAGSSSNFALSAEVDSSATLNFGSTQHLAGISVLSGTAAVASGANKVLMTKSLAFNGTSSAPIGKLDLTDNDLILDYTGSTPLATLAAQIKAAYASGAWTGAGITSTSAAAVAANSSNIHKTALGYAEASFLNVSTFSGQSVDGTALLVRYTLAGDANIDGTVNTQDFTALSNNYAKSGKFWFNGDFNNDGVVNALDFNSIATNFGQNLPSPALGALVPEPTILSLAVMGMFLPRRGRRKPVV